MTESLQETWELKEGLEVRRAWKTDMLRPVGNIEITAFQCISKQSDPNDKCNETDGVVYRMIVTTRLSAYSAGQRFIIVLAGGSVHVKHLE